MPRSPPRRRSTRRWGPATLPPWDMWHPPRVAPPGRPSAAVSATARVSTCSRRYPSGARPRYGPIVRSGPAGSKLESPQADPGSGSGSGRSRTLIRSRWGRSPTGREVAACRLQPRTNTEDGVDPVLRPHACFQPRSARYIITRLAPIMAAASEGPRCRKAPTNREQSRRSRMAVPCWGNLRLPKRSTLGPHDEHRRP